MKWNRRLARRFGIALAWVLLLTALGGCAWWQQNKKQIVSTITDVAIDLCRIFASEQEAEALGGLSPKDFCEIAENLQPFIDAAAAAKQSAGKAALKRTSGGDDGEDG